MGESADLVLVTSQAWCDRLAKLLLEVKASHAGFEEMRSDGRTLRLNVIAPRGPYDPYAAAQKYVSRNLPVPVRIVRAMLEDRKPKKGGRHTHPEQWAAEKANAISCYLSMERLLSTEPAVSQTAAGIRIGKLRGRSCAAVVRAWKHFKQAP